MPELPEVEVVRRGLADHVVGRRFTEVTVLHPRAVRTTERLAERLTGALATQACRRGKYLWLPLTSPDRELPALAMHLRMSGQLLIRPTATPVSVHTRIIAGLDDGMWVHFVDQRTFGYWALQEPEEILGAVAPDLLEVAGGVGANELVGRLKRRRGALKAALLDQHLVSGIGNIYADEMLWRARLHPLQDPSRVSPARLSELVAAGVEVMVEAIAAGGTSFDSLYVNVNGQSGYFSRSLDAYGWAGQPCRRCGSALVRVRVAGRSAVLCPVCQRRY